MTDNISKEKNSTSMIFTEYNLEVSSSKRRRTRSRTVPSQSSAVATKPKVNGGRKTRSYGSETTKTSAHQQELQITPSFTWDIPKTHMQLIYKELGVKEMDNEGATVGVSDETSAVRKKAKSANKPTNSSGVVEVNVVSPDQFKPLQEHIHNGHACSCKKQLLLEKSEDPFYTLSDEIILAIFRWLPMTMLARCAQVCKHWNHLVFDDTLWRRIDLSTKTFSSGSLGRVLERGTVAAKLSRCNIRGNVFEDDAPTEPPLKLKRTTSRTTKHSKAAAAATSRPDLHLQYLDLTASEAQPAQIAAILDRCPANQIKKLSLESCAVNDDVMKSVANHGESLVELNLCMCTGLRGDGLRILLTHCPRLTTLNLSWTGLQHKDLTSFVECAPRSLEKLNLSGFRHSLKNDDVVSLSHMCLNMRELDLSDSTVIGFTAIDAIVENMTQLQHIALSRCYNIPQLSFVQLGSLRNLRALDIFGLVQESGMLESIQEVLPRMQINIHPFSAIARPTTKQRSNIWEMVCYE